MLPAVLAKAAVEDCEGEPQLAAKGAAGAESADEREQIELLCRLFGHAGRGKG